jgi:hypothetical protein
MKYICFLLFLFFFGKTTNAQSFEKIDSVRIYYMDLSYHNRTPISPDRVKTFPLTQLLVIKDSQKLSLIKEKLSLLRKADIKFKNFDPRVLCEIFFNKKKATILINGTKYFYFRSKTFMPEESLFKLLYPKPENN